MKAHKLFGSSRLVLTILLLVGGLTASAVTYADSIFTPLNSVFEGSFLSGFSRSGPTTPNAQIVSEPSVTTDQGEYAPGQIVQISGSGFAPNELVTLQIVHVDTNSFALKDEFSLNSYDHHGHDPWQVMVGADGTFASSWLVEDNSYGKTLLLTADQPATETHGALHAEVTFLDAIGFNKGVYNKDDFPPDSTGDWTTGNAGSHYEEGQWVYYQYQVAGIGAGNPTPDFDIKFNHYQSNVNAIFIDAFANFRACVDCEEDSFLSGPKEGMLLDDVPYPSTDTTNWKSAISAISFINGTLNASGQCVATEDPVNTPSQEHCFKVDGEALEDLFPGVDFSSGTHTITLFYEAHLSNTRTWKNGKQSLIGCPTSIHYANPGPEVVPADTVYGTEAYSGGDPCVEGEAGDWNGVFNGVGFATGSSRHFNIINQTAGSQGQLSLPIPTVEAPTGSITIVKVTQPSPATGAVFGFSGDLGPFNLDTDPATAGTSHTITFNDIPANIPFSVTESSMPTDWALTTIVCSVDTGGSQSTDVPTATATVTLPSTNGASATCTFTNRNDNLLNGRIIVVKQTSPDGDPQEFTFTPSYNGGTTFDLSDGESNDSCEGGPNCLPQGLYSVEETVPADWVLSSATCDDGSPVNAIDLGQGETVTCTFNNTKLTADIEVTKTVDEDEICLGSNTQVTYTYQVTNPGTAGLPTVTVVDDNGTPADTGDDFSPIFQSGDDGDGVLEPGETWVYTANKSVSASITNTVTATGTTAGGQQDSDTATATVTAAVCTITVTKSADADAVCIGSSTTYDFSIKNNSDTFTWTGTLVDDVVGDIGGGNFSLAPGETKTFNNVAGPVLNVDTTNTVTGDGAFDDPASSTDSDTASDTVTVSDCTITVTKSADADAVCIGSSTTYDFSIKNNSDTFTWTGTFVDDVVGDIGGGAVVLAPGETKTFNNVAGPALLVDTTNTVTGDGAFDDPASSTDSDTASDTVTVSDCTITVTKSADADTVCIGGSTTYDFSIKNNSDTFTWTGTFVDDVVGDIGGGAVVLAPGETKTFNNVAGPALLVDTTNTVTGDGAFDDPASSTDSDTASDTVTVSDCTITVTKTPSALNVCNGATVTYDFSIKNNSDTFTWTGTLVDNVIGDIGGGPVVLAPGATSNFNNVPWVINGTVNNTVTGDGTFDDGSGSSDSDTASATVTGNTCRIIVVKQTLPDGDPTTFNFTGDLTGTIGDGGSIQADVIAPGAYSTTEAVPTGWDLTNRVCNDGNSVGSATDVGPGGSGSVTYNVELGETVTCTFTNTKRGHLELEKFTNGQARPDIDINFNLYRDGVVDGDLSGDETLVQSLSTLGDADGNLVFNDVPPGNYTVCEYPVPAGFTSMWTINGGVVTPYNPQANDTPPEDTGIRCFDFTIAAGQTVSIHVDNDFPGGDPRTIGYWKNWNRCTNGGQAANADANGGGANGFWLLEDLLPQDIGDLTVANCQDGVDILNKSDLSGKKKANDAAYELAAQLLAAKLNLAAGAETCTAVQDAVMDGQNLLEAINFNGTGNYLTSKVKGPAAATRTQALQLANTLDQYNNGNLCP